MNPGGFDFEAWMPERNLRASGYVRAGRHDPSPQRVQPMVWSPAYAIERARSALRDQLLPHLENKRYGGVLLALVLGDQRAISDADWTLFNRTESAIWSVFRPAHPMCELGGLLIGALWRVRLTACALGRANRGGDRRLGRRIAIRAARRMGSAGAADGADVGDGRRGVDFQLSHWDGDVARTGCSTRMPG